MKKIKDLNFKEVYKLPLTFDEWWSKIYIYTANNVVAFNCLISDKQTVNMVLDILNGLSERAISDDVIYENGYIKVDGKPILLLRGWGYLTGCCALNLPSDKAAQIQDDFANWVVNMLKSIEK